MLEYIRLLDFPSSPLVYTAIILTEIYWDLQMSNFSLTDEILTKFYTNGLVVTERSAQLRICLSVSHALGIVELNFNLSGTLICLIYWNCWTTEKVASKYGGKVDVKAKDELCDSI